MGTINIPFGTILEQSYDLDSNETVNGPGFFAPGSFADGGNATINAITLAGTFTTGTVSGNVITSGNLTFTNFVSPLVTADLTPQATISIEHPHEFFGSIGYVNPDGSVAPFGEYVDLVGLANADSYTLKNDLVFINGSNGFPVDLLRVSSEIAASLALPGSTTNLIEDGGSVYLTLGYGELRIPGGFGAGTILHAT
jgi:hypothetical protein